MADSKAEPPRSPNSGMTWGQMQALMAASASAAPASDADGTGASTAAVSIELAGGAAPGTPQRARSGTASQPPATPPGAGTRGTGVTSSAQRAASGSTAPGSPGAAAPTPMRASDAKALSVSVSTGGIAGPVFTSRPTTARTEEDERRIGNLLTAAAKGDTKRIESYLTSGVDVNAGDYDRRTALHLACAEGQLAAVRLLVEQFHARTDVKDRFGHLPLDDAIAHAHEPVSAYLRSLNAASGAIDKHEANLILAASQGDVATAERLLKSGVSPNCCDYYRRTPLHLAVTESHPEMVRLLLEHKADPRVPDRHGMTAEAEAKRMHIRTGADPIGELITAAVGGSQESEAEKHKSRCSKFVWWFGCWEVAIIVLFGAVTEYHHEAGGRDDPTSDESMNAVSRLYPLYQDIHVMIFIGFGFLMTFLRKNGYSALGWTFMLCAFAVQWYNLVRGFWLAVFTGDWATKIHLSIETLLLGDFAAGAVMITYGVVLGKVSPLQMLFTAGLEVIFFALNERIALRMEIADIGGSMVIHMFGAFFGLAFSRVVSPFTKAKGNENNAAGYHSDIFAMIGTVFLWLFWPSFNGGLGKGNTQHRAIINTVLALAGSCVAAFIASYSLRREHKFCMVDIQNATLAGGVAMGTCADMIVLPGPAIALGAIAGVVTTWGYVHLQSLLEEKLSLHDTCGVNNLHGMPSILGALAGVIAAYRASVDTYGEQLPVVFPARASDGSGRSANDQAAYQFAFMIITLAIAISSGLLTGLIVRSTEFDPVPLDDKQPGSGLFMDSAYWEVPSLEQPYYFDSRGEIARKQRIKPRVERTASMDGGSGPISAAAAQQTRILEQRVESLENQLAAARSNNSVEQLTTALQSVFDNLQKRA